MLLAAALAAVAAADGGTAAPAVSWERLADGVELAILVLDPKPAFADGKLSVVRIDPARAQLKFALASAEGEGRTAGDWANAKGFVATINAGMFQTDHLSNVGLLVDGDHKNNGRWHPDYKSALAFGPKKKGIPAAVFVDLDAEGAKESLADYASVVQNLRLLKAPASNVWKPNARKWSEAAIGADSRGRILFLFSRSPMEMHDWNERLRALPLDVQRAMHVEGGPEASLSIRTKAKKLDLCGSYETRFLDNDGNTRQWPLPNVIGVVAKP